jgi:hypothetical protein
MQSKSNYRLKHEQFANFLDNATAPGGKKIEWNWWCTFTTGYELTMNSARRSMNRLFEQMVKESETKMMWAAEPFDVKDGFHTHAMLSTTLTFEQIGKIWQIASAGIRYGKHNRVQLDKYDPKKGAGFYVSKYVSKKLSDWDIYHQLDVGNTMERVYQKPHKRVEVDSIENHINKAEFSAPIYIK